MKNSTLLLTDPYAMRRNLILPLLAALLIVGAASPIVTKAATIKDVLMPAAPASVQIGGRLGEKLDLCVTHRILAQDVESVVAPFRARTETGGADWRSEYWGKWFTSLTLADAYQSTPATRQLRDQAAEALIATALPDGYIGTRSPAHRLEGWDVWGCKYVLLGLIADYDRTHDGAMLDAARRETDVLIAELGPGRTSIADVGEWNGLPASSVLGGEPGRGFAQMMKGLETGRIQVASRALGVATAALEDALAYAQTRESFGQPIWKHQAIGHYLADMATKLTAARQLTLHAAERYDSGERADMEAGMAKLFASEAAMEIALNAVRIHGGYGYSTEYDVERYFRDAPLMIVGEGTNEIQRNVIASQLVARGGI